MKRLTIVTGLLLVFMLEGCGGRTTTQKEFKAQVKSPPAAVQVEVDDGSSPGEAVLGEPKLSKSGIKAAGPQTTMYLAPGVDRIWQNGPSPEEQKKANHLRPRRPKMAKEEQDAFSAPVFDTSGLRLIDE